jgi:hypothetical protein
MKKSILNETDGWDIFHNGVNRTFRDIEQVAIAARSTARSVPQTGFMFDAGLTAARERSCRI